MIVTQKFMKKYGVEPRTIIKHTDGKAIKYYYIVQPDLCGLSHINPDEVEYDSEDGIVGKLLEVNTGKFCVLPTFYDPPEDLRNENDPHSKRDIIYYCGPSGSGKTFTATMFAREYHSMYPDNNIILISPMVPDDGPDSLSVLNPIVFDITNPDVAYLNFIDPATKLTPGDLRNSLVLVDDLENVNDKALLKGIQELMNNLLMTGRHFRVSLCINSHIPCRGSQTKAVLAETRFICVFPFSAPTNKNKYLLTNYCGLNPADMAYIRKKRSRWVLIHSQGPPMIIGDKFIKMLD